MKPVEKAVKSNGAMLKRPRQREHKDINKPKRAADFERIFNDELKKDGEGQWKK